MHKYKHPAPTYALKLNGKNITPRINPRLEQLTLSEARSEQADELDIVLTDYDGKLEIPPKGVVLKLALGYKGEALIEKGKFLVDEVQHSGPPDKLTIRARSADLTSDMRRRRSQSWHEQSLGDIIQTIASRNSLQPRIDTELAAISLAHIDQTSESDIAFISRLARHFDAVATVKNGSLIFLKINATKTANGAELPQVTIDRKETQSHSFTSADRDSYSGVRARYENVKAAARGEVLAGCDKNVKELPDIYAKKEEADKAAKAEWQRIERSTSKLELILATGRLDIMPQSIVKVTGFKSDICAITWLAVRVGNSLTADGGLITSLELEICSQKTEIEARNKKAKSGKGSSDGGFWE